MEQGSPRRRSIAGFLSFTAASVAAHKVFPRRVVLPCFNRSPYFRFHTLKDRITTRRCVASFVLLATVFCPQVQAPAAAAEAPLTGRPLFQRLRIDALKNTLRLAPSGDRPAALFSFEAYYKDNRFAALLEAFEALPEAERPAPLHLIYGNALVFLGQNEAAVRAYQQAFRLAGGPGEKAAAMTNFGYLLSIEKNWQAARERLEAALAIDRACGDWEAQAKGLSLLGDIYLQLGQPDRGVASHIEALEIAETLPIPWLQARQLETLGRLYAQDGILHLAGTHFREARKIFQRLEDPLGEAATLSGLAGVEQKKAAFDKALEHQRAALALYRKLEDRENETQALLHLSLIHRDKGDFSSAIDLAMILLARQTKAGNRYAMAEIEGTLGTIYEKKGDLEKAMLHWENARRHFQEAGLPQQIHIVELRIQALRDRIDVQGN